VAWPHLVPTVVTGLQAGAHEVRLELEDKPPIVRRIKLTIGTPILLQGEHTDAKPVLTLKSTPSRAVIRVGGRPVGETPARLEDLEASVEHTVVMEKSGFHPASLTLTLAPGETREVTMNLLAVKAVAPTVVTRTVVEREAAVQMGFLTLHTVPWVKVAIDGKPFGSTPLYKAELTAGPHEIVLVNEELGINTKRRVIVEPGATKKVDLKLAK
jgi:hypothetical protein